MMSETNEPDIALEPETPTNVFDSPTDEVQEGPIPDPVETPEAPRYTPWNHSMASVCAGCGSLVIDTTAHDEFHGYFE